MDFEPLIHELRGALRLHKVECHLSALDLEAILRDSIEEIGDKRRVDDIVECAVAKADSVCREISAGVDPASVTVPSCRAAKKGRR
jgi:hypothetical protein